MRVTVGRGASPRDERAAPPATAHPSAHRSIDYSLQRRAVLREVYAGRVGTFEVCDASPYLRSAARFHGEATEKRCPICRREFVTHVHYIYGDQLKHSAGQARRRAELTALADTLGEFQVFVVEVCRRCNWNHLVEQYLMGKSVVPAAAPLDLREAEPRNGKPLMNAPTGTV